MPPAVRALLAAARERLSAPNLPWLTFLAGLLGAAVAAATAAGIYDAVVENEGIAGLDRPTLELAIRWRTPARNRVVTGYTQLGGPLLMPILVCCAALALARWWRSWTPVMLIVATAAGSLTMTLVGKLAVGRARPPLADAVAPFESSTSFPSGHALNSVALVGVIAHLVTRRQARPISRWATLAVAGLLALTMGGSRVFLGHHWLTDVLVAWVLGIGWLTMVITGHRLWTARRARSAPGARPERPAG
jgi:undecaprenyl-diphosphatase